MEIYFDDLKEEAQEELLKLYNISSPDEMNWDHRLVPVAIVPDPAWDE